MNKMTKRQRNGLTKTSSIVIISILAVFALISIFFNRNISPKQLVLDNNDSSSISKLIFSGTLPIEVELGQIQDINWASENYQPKTVSIQLIKQVSNSPISYELVRVLVDKTKNDGHAVWIPAKQDLTDNLLVEINCDSSTIACVSSKNDKLLAVINSDRYSNTATIMQSRILELLMNR